MVILNEFLTSANEFVAGKNAPQARLPSAGGGVDYLGWSAAKSSDFL